MSQKPVQKKQFSHDYNVSTLLHDAINFTKFIDITAKSKVSESVNTFSSSAEKIKALETELK